jgi:hypothetical protein
VSNRMKFLKSPGRAVLIWSYRHGEPNVSSVWCGWCHSYSCLLLVKFDCRTARTQFNLIALPKLCAHCPGQILNRAIAQSFYAGCTAVCTPRVASTCSWTPRHRHTSKPLSKAGQESDWEEHARRQTKNSSIRIVQ